MFHLVLLPDGISTQADSVIEGNKSLYKTERALQMDLKL